MTTVIQAMLLNKDAIKKIIGDDSFNKWSIILTTLIGVVYGFVAFLNIPGELVDFDSNVLRFVALIVVILVSILMVYVTKLGLAFLLWAGGRAFGGPGLFRILNRVTSIALFPIILGSPAIVAINFQTNISVIMSIVLTFSIFWMYLISVKSVELTQKIKTWKAYLAVIISFIFFISVYYIILPTS